MNRVYLANLGYFLENASEMEKVAFLAKNIPFVSEERKAKIQAYYFSDDKVRSLAAYALLAFALKQQKGIVGPLDFAIQTEGKPYLSKHQDSYFNLSHCHGWVACIIGDHEVGIDIQEHFAYDEAVAKQFCSTQELQVLAAKGCDARLLNRFWVLKEAYTKYLGKGLMANLTELDFSDKAALEQEGCTLSVLKNQVYNLAICIRKGTELTITEVSLNLANYNLYDLFS